MILRRTIAAYASQLRENMGIGENAAIGHLVHHIKEAGYEYLEESFGDEFSGFSQSLGGGKYLIGFNREHLWSIKFQRFTLSHELGHLTIPEHRRILDNTGLHRSKSEFQSQDPIEREADYFAICFLTPRKSFQDAMKHKEYTKDTIFGLSEKFGISAYATILRFIELTDQSCTLIVSNSTGMIEYERRSNRMKESCQQNFLAGKKIKETTLTFDYIKGRKGENSCTVSLREWFEDLPEEIEIDATESVIDLGYNNKYLTLLTPHVTDVDEYSRDWESPRSFPKHGGRPSTY